MQKQNAFLDWAHNEKTGGIVLIIATAASLLLANSGMAQRYISLWEFQMGGHSIVHWINDGLMTLFFLQVGLELREEIVAGELSNLKTAALPLVSALGGMLLPAVIFLLFNFGLPTQSGAGIPMATDIAFAIGVLALLGKRVPASLKIFLLALAVIDDLGAIAVIAIAYTQTITTAYLVSAILVFALLLLANRLKVTAMYVYIIGGIALWYCMLNSGVHATIAGVLLAFTIPRKNAKNSSPAELLRHGLHLPITLIVLPLFAMANTCIGLSGGIKEVVTSNNGIGIIAGLLIGKPLGIFLFGWIAAKIKICQLPQALQWKSIAAAGMLGGIGFTMSIFITLLAFTDNAVIQQSKIAILAASVISALLGLGFLHLTLKRSSYER